MSEEESYVAGTAIGQTRFLIPFQIGSSILTFILNSLIARRVGPAIFGFAAIDLYVVYSAVMGLSREYLRRVSSLFHPSDHTLRQKERKIFALGYWGIVIASIISGVIIYLFNTT